MLKCCIFRCWLIVSVSILNLALFCSTLPVALLVVDMSPSQSFSLWFAQHLESLCLLLSSHDCLDLSCFVLLNTSSHSAHCRHTSLSQSFLLWFAQHLESLCSLLTLSRLSQPFLNTSTRSGHSSHVSDSFLNTLTFVELVLVSFIPLCRSNLFLLMFHSPKLLQYFNLYLPVVVMATLNQI